MTDDDTTTPIQYTAAYQADRDSEALGKLVRAEWERWAREQTDVKASWLVSWEQLSEPAREVDRRIGERLFAAGYEQANADRDRLARELAAAQTEIAALRAAGREVVRLLASAKHGLGASVVWGIALIAADVLAGRDASHLWTEDSKQLHAALTVLARATPPTPVEED